MEFWHIFKVISYFILLLPISYYCIKSDWKRYLRLKDVNNTKRIRISTIIVISFFVGIYSLSYNHTFWWADVTYYSRLFSSGLPIVEAPSLNFIYFILHKFTNNIDVLLFTVSFSGCFIALYAYREYVEAKPQAVFLLFLTTFLVEYCQGALKQATAIGLLYLAIVWILDKKDVLAGIVSIIAFFFHESALIIIPIYLILKFEKKIKLKLLVMMLMLLVFGVFFKQILVALSVFTRIGIKITTYFSENSELTHDSTGFIVIKGLPLYIITTWGFIKRRKLSEKIIHFNAYLDLSLIGSITYLLSYHSYWMSRYSVYFYLSDMVLFTQMLDYESESNQKILYYGMVGMLSLLLFRWLVQVYL